jgi:hypothetical protein
LTSEIVNEKPLDGNFAAGGLVRAEKDFSICAFADGLRQFKVGAGNTEFRNVRENHLHVQPAVALFLFGHFFWVNEIGSIQSSEPG